jgi:hypothetical protein
MTGLQASNDMYSELRNCDSERLYPQLSSNPAASPRRFATETALQLHITATFQHQQNTHINRATESCFRRRLARRERNASAKGCDWLRANVLWPPSICTRHRSAFRATCTSAGASRNGQRQKTTKSPRFSLKVQSNFNLACAFLRGLLITLLNGLVAPGYVVRRAAIRTRWAAVPGT